MSWTTPQPRNEARGLIHWVNQWEMDPLMVDNGLPSPHDETEANWSWQFWQLVMCTMKQDLGVLTLMAFLYFDPGSSPQCVHGSKSNLQNGPAAKNMFNLCQAYDSTFGILIFEPSSCMFLDEPLGSLIYQHLRCWCRLHRRGPEKKVRPILMLLFKDGRGESPQLHGVKQRCTKKKKTKSAMWQYHFFVEFLASDTTFLHGWLHEKMYCAWQVNDAHV